MSFDPEEMGFAWPRPTEVQNAYGHEMRVKPCAARAFSEGDDAGYKECCRLYDTPLGILSERQLKHWQTGGMQTEMELLAAYRSLFAEAQSRFIPVQTVCDKLVERGFHELQVQIVLGWLIIGGYVEFSVDTLEVSNTDDN